ncbi:pilus assembly FimT family protein [Shewanella halifaxensis]|uniref:pilus assembly FimT family protein n=1 Tax=Shewanella halifaxensis TaxID=271098 RepID=UPI000D58F2AE|nr:type II secretion system protein [Shewanella halifaxensis]
MLAFNRSNKGFTLIELMVILLIMGVLLSLVGPLAVKNVDKTNSRTEELQLKNWFDKVSQSAFYRSQIVTISLQGRAVNATVDVAASKVKIDSIMFDSLFFPPQELELNKNGFFKQESVNYQSADKRFKITLQPVRSY